MQEYFPSLHRRSDKAELDGEKFPFSLIGSRVSRLPFSAVFFFFFFLLIALICKVEVVFPCVKSFYFCEIITALLSKKENALWTTAQAKLKSFMPII